MLGTQDALSDKDMFDICWSKKIEAWVKIRLLDIFDLSIIFSKKAKIAKSLFMKNSRNNSIILGFSVWFYVFSFSWSNG